MNYKNFQFNVSDTQAMKQLGNSVCVDVVKALVKQVAPYIEGKQSPIQEQQLQLQ